jgi:hypothetical protein
MKFLKILASISLIIFCILLVILFNNIWDINIIYIIVSFGSMLGIMLYGIWFK